MLNDEIKTAMRESVLCWLATVSDQGMPNVSPKEMFVPFGDDCMLIANIASPKSVRNIRNHAVVCVSFVEIFKQKGFKLQGKAVIFEKSASDYPLYLQALHELGGEAFPVKSIIKVIIDEVSPIIAPSYWLFPETSEQEQIQQAMKTYGVVNARDAH